MNKLWVFLLGLLAVTVYGADVQLGWEDPTGPTNNVVRYKLYWATGSTGGITNVVITTNLTASVTNITPGVYRFFVTAQNAWGTESDPSSVIVTPANVKPNAVGLSNITYNGVGGSIISVTVP